MRKLHIASKLSLPVEAETETFAIIGKRGVGKTATAVVMTEELLKADQQVAVIDPLDAWWGLRSSADGKGPGFPITVLGGSHGDLPLAEESGSIIADFVVDQGISVVLSLRHLSKNGQRRFVTNFCSRLYHRKGEAQHRTPLHIMIDEADAFVPQRIFSGQEQMIGAIDDLVRRGRSSGIGVTLITQRAAVIHKDVLTQIEVLISMRTISPQDRKALETWIEAHDAHDQRGEFMESLASLEKGEAWFWSPGWLGIFQRVQVRRRHTFDSSATPKIGERLVKPKDLAPVDLEKLTLAIADTIEKAKAEDPRELKKQIAELKKQLAAKGDGKKPAAVSGGQDFARGYEKGARETIVAVSKDQAAKDKSIRDLLNRTRRKLMASMDAWGDEPSEEIDAALSIILKANALEAAPLQMPAPKLELKKEPPYRMGQSARPTSVDAGALGKGDRQILAAIAQYPEGATRQQLTVLTGYKRSTRDRYIQYLQAAGRIVISGDRIRATESGIEALGDDFQPLPTGEALRKHWLDTLPEGESKILAIVIAAYPDTVDRNAISELAEYQRSTRDRYIQYLQARQLVEAVGRGEVRASAELF